MLFGRRAAAPVTREEALPGRAERPFPLPARHLVLGTPLDGPVPDGHEVAVFGMGCFWGAERIFWRLDGVRTTAAGYAGGFTPNPTYDETCSGRTGHTEAVRVVFDPAVVPYERLLKEFWENHDPTTPNRQGNDVGTQYRSAVYTTTPEQAETAERSRERYQAALSGAGHGSIATELAPLGEFWFAEPYHQQYLQANPRGYCNHGFCQARYELGDHGQEQSRVALPTG